MANGSRTVVAHFKWDELKCKCGNPNCVGLPPVNSTIMSFLKRISVLRDICGVPLIVNSFYRCKHHKLYRKESAHSDCLAIDLSPRGITPVELYLLAEGFFFSGLGIRDLGKREERFVHLDIKTGRIARWKYKDVNGKLIPEYLFIRRQKGDICRE